MKKEITFKSFSSSENQSYSVLGEVMTNESETILLFDEQGEKKVSSEIHIKKDSVSIHRKGEIKMHVCLKEKTKSTLLLALNQSEVMRFECFTRHLVITKHGFQACYEIKETNLKQNIDVSF